MPTISGMRRRGYTPESIRNFIERVGVAKNYSIVDVSLLEYCVREDLNKRVPRVMGVLRPLKVVIDNYPEDQEEELEAMVNPEDPAAGTRKVWFSRELYIEQDDFRENPPPKYFRLAPGKEVRLRSGYFIRCDKVVKNPSTGQVLELHCTYDPATRGGYAPDGRKVQGTLHWVSARHCLDAEARLYDRLFLSPDPTQSDPGGSFIDNINPDSLEILSGCKVEANLANARPGYRCQFERMGYFCVDPDSTTSRLVFNRTATLRDTWAKIEESQKR
jgi:glutaminyl-tRNA synthetase